MDLEQAITEQQTFGSLRFNDQEPMHIAFGVDANFIRPMGVTITSVIANNRDQNMVFHVFANSIEQTDVERLQLLACNEQVLLHLYRIDQNVFQAMRTTWNLTAATYNRFIVAKFLYPQVQKVLYIDADIVCQGALAELLQSPFNGYIAMVVNDRQKLGSEAVPIPPSKQYFNAGMLYINLQAWNENQISEHAMDLLQTRSFPKLDQDALNIVLQGKAKFIDTKWNEICNMEKSASRISPEAVLVHFIGRNKPWHVWCLHPAKELFIAYASRSLWKDVPFCNQPRSYREMKLMGAARFQQGKYREALTWYWKYWREKRKNR